MYCFQVSVWIATADPSFPSLLKRRQIAGSEQCAVATAQILLQVVAKAKYADVDALLERVQRTGRKLVEARPQELVIGNIVRRVLGLIRDEAEEDRNGNEEFGNDSVPDLQAISPKDDVPVPIPRVFSRPPALSASSSFVVPQSMFNLLSASPLVDSSGTGSPYGRDSGTSTPLSHSQHTSVHALRSEVIDGIGELLDEVGQVDDQIATFADVQIHPQEYVLVYRPSACVERFLLRAAAKRQFTVFLAGDSSPKAGAAAAEPPFASLRKKLGAAGVKTINIASSGIMAYMPKVSKVILGSRAVVADGGVVAEGGAGLVARAAHEYGKPVIVLSGVYKLCPEDPFDLHDIIEYGDPSDFVSFADGSMVNGVDVESAVTEFVGPEFVDIYISNL